MNPTHAGAEMLAQLAGRNGRNDRIPHMPLIGFILGTGFSLLLWGLIGWSAWVLVS